MMVSANFLSLDFSLKMKAVLLMMFFTSVPWKVAGLILGQAGVLFERGREHLQTDDLSGDGVEGVEGSDALVCDVFPAESFLELGEQLFSDLLQGFLVLGETEDDLVRSLYLAEDLVEVFADERLEPVEARVDHFERAFLHLRVGVFELLDELLEDLSEDFFGREPGLAAGSAEGFLDAPDAVHAVVPRLLKSRYLAVDFVHDVSEVAGQRDGRGGLRPLSELAWRLVRLGLVFFGERHLVYGLGGDLRASLRAVGDGFLSRVFACGFARFGFFLGEGFFGDGCFFEG